jgi:3-deoxy-D-manno-octulosonate 8-phosphate phosphatase (KDO 8-P phosphatase)
VRLLLLDVDGVLTDGRIILDDHGVETKHFHVRDGSALALWRRLGLRAGVLTGRSSQVVARRAAELGLEPVVQGAGDKAAAFGRLCSELALDPAEVAYMGDDWPDLPVLARAGLAACPADADPDVQAHAHVVADAPGGRGAVREVIAAILRARRQWDDALASFLTPAGAA